MCLGLKAQGAAARVPQEDGALGLKLLTNWPRHLSGRMTSEVTRKRSRERRMATRPQPRPDLPAPQLGTSPGWHQVGVSPSRLLFWAGKNAVWETESSSHLTTGEVEIAGWFLPEDY